MISIRVDKLRTKTFCSELVYICDEECAVDVSAMDQTSGEQQAVILHTSQGFGNSIAALQSSATQRTQPHLVQFMRQNVLQVMSETMQIANGNTFSLDAGSELQVDANNQKTSVTLTQPQLASLTPPKKPLSPYMTFSKEIWPHVKAMTTNATVCEIGATIGRLWRELDDATKQRYNRAFILEKQRYDVELQSYLRATGRHASDLVKPRCRKRDVKSAAATMASSIATEPNVVSGQNAVESVHYFSPVWTRPLPDVFPQSDSDNARTMATVASSLLLTSLKPTETGCEPQPKCSIETSALTEQVPEMMSSDLESSLRANSADGQLLLLSTSDELKSEVIQMRNALSQQILEAQRLMRELETANRVVDELRALC